MYSYTFSTLDPLKLETINSQGMYNSMGGRKSNLGIYRGTLPQVCGGAYRSEYVCSCIKVVEGCPIICMTTPMLKYEC